MSVLSWFIAEVLHLAWKLNLYKPPDRRVLEREILPELVNDPSIQRVLFVGVRWYNAGHSALFAGKTFATIDPDPEQARFGSSLHAIDVVQNLEHHFGSMVFDAVVISGVIGWGINTPAELEQALSAFARAMRPGAWLVLGLNPLITHHVQPVDMEASKAFEPAPFSHLGMTFDVALPFKEKLHRFEFWQRR